MLKDVGVPSPDACRILIAENEGGELVAFWCMVQVVHCEPIWIAPEYRNGTLAGRMWAKMKVLLDHSRVHMAYMFSDTPHIAGYLQRLGLIELPYRTFLFDPEGSYPMEHN